MNTTLHIDPRPARRRGAAIAAVTAAQREGRPAHLVTIHTCDETHLRAIRAALMQHALADEGSAAMLVVDDAARLTVLAPRQVGSLMRTIDTAIESGAEVLVTTGTADDEIGRDVLAIGAEITHGRVTIYEQQKLEAAR